MSAQTTPITERQLDLITRAHCDANGLIEPLLDLKGGAKLKMIASLAQRGLIEQQGGQWRLTPAAISIIKGEAQPEDVLPPTGATSVATSPLASDPELEAAVAAAEASWQQDQPDAAPKRGRDNSKQALVIEMLKRPEGATIAQICEATGWQAHTVRGTFAGALKKKLGMTIVSEKIEGPAGTPGAGQRLYRIAEEATALSTQPDEPIPADLLPTLLVACREMQIELGFHRPKRVTTGVATINHQEPEMNTTTQIPAPTVTDFGFFGTMAEHAEAAWPLAMTAISDATGQPLESVRTFLDSRHGRHFADDVQNGLYAGATLADAIAQATARWMGWTIGRSTSKQYGIPKGLPYLTGFVIHCEIVEESLAA